MTFEIKPFEPKYESGVISLIERIQEGEFNLPIGDAQRKELHSIPDSFQKNKGNYWIGLFKEKVIGTIAVIDIGHHALELRDVFLDADYRGPITKYAQALLDNVFDWSRSHEIHTIFLGTTLAFTRAHSFYEKNSFREIKREEMPSYCQPMDCDEKFYRYDFKC